MTTVLRCLLVAALVIVTVTLQVSVFSHFAVDGVAPDLALLLVIGAALVRGPTYASLVGFAAGLVLDLAPPADHTAGRWALALVLVGYFTGLAKPDGRLPLFGTVLIVASGAFIGTSLYALSGLALGEQSVTVELRTPRGADRDPVRRRARSRRVPLCCWLSGGSTRRALVTA